MEMKIAKYQNPEIILLIYAVAKLNQAAAAVWKTMQYVSVRDSTSNVSSSVRWCRSLCELCLEFLCTHTQAPFSY